MNSMTIKNVWQGLLFSVCCVPLLTLAQSTDSQALPPGVVAIVNGEKITESQVLDTIKLTGLPDSPQLHSAVKGQLVARELFRQQAIKNPALEKRPEVKKAMQDAKEAAMVQLYLRDSIKPAAVTDDMLREQFNNIVNSLGPNEYKVRVIQVADDAAAQNVLTQLKGGADFAALAAKLSLASNKNRGGELEWVSFKLPAQEGQTQNLPLPEAQAISQLTPGSLTTTPVVWNNERFIIRLDQLRPTQIPQFDAVKDALRKTMERQALERATLSLVGGLTKSAKIQQ
jgi:peptidyl-prolyl cis-trans isomerase C